MKYIIYRDKTTNKINGYSKYKKHIEDINELIKNYNSSHTRSAELVTLQDFISLIEIAEENKKYTESHIRTIEDAFDKLTIRALLFKRKF